MTGVAVDAQGGCVVAEDNPYQQGEDDRAACDVGDVFLLNAFFLFELNIHNFKIYDFAIYCLLFTIYDSSFLILF